jgi:hypothetical protein
LESAGKWYGKKAKKRERAIWGQNEKDREREKKGFPLI